MATSNLDLSVLFPKRYRDKTLDTFVRALFNRHLTKDQSETLYGYVGDTNVPDRSTDDIYLVERDLERKINQLVPVAYGKHATEERAVSWAELVQRLVLLGVPYDDIAAWLSTQSFNFAPPIDLDKFCNFNEYFWIGAWVQANPALDYSSLGLPDIATYVAPAATRSNSTYRQEYYVIARGELSGVAPVTPYAPLTSWTDWSLLNLWVHRDDVLVFLNSNSDVLSFADLVPARLPIIEYAIDLKLSTYVDVDGAPADAGTLQVYEKHTPNQPPLFDLYYHDGTHASLASAILFYQEDSAYVVDGEIQRRIVRDENNDTVFGLGTVSDDTGELLWYKRWNDLSFDLTCVWVPGPEEATARYVKYDTSGTIINRDKFLNYRDYYWTASDVDQLSLPPYNMAADPEYYVVEADGTSDWAVDNHWVHVSNLQRADLTRYPQAQRAIIEFNKVLESELVVPTKTTLNQIPKFNIYHLDQLTDTYEVLPTTSIDPLVDAYSEGCLLAHLDDLVDARGAITSSADLTSLLLTEDGVNFVQTLVSGYYAPEKNAVTYGYYMRESGRTSVGDGQLTAASAINTATPQVFALTALDPNTFAVRSTVYGALPNLTTGVAYNQYGSTFTILVGSTPFVAGDVIQVETRSVIFERQNLYVKLGTVYRTFDAPRDIIDSDYTTLRLVDATPSLRDGAWQAPAVLSENMAAETRTTIGEGDLTYHFTSIIDAQVGLLGSANGNNNWRELTTRDYGLGGFIKQHNNRFALLVGLLMQEKLTALDVIDFASGSYEEAIVKIREYVEEQLVDEITDGTAQPVSSDVDPLDHSTYALMKEYLELAVSIVDTTTTVVDDTLARPYFDTTMPVKALTATLPYQGLDAKVVPERRLDHELNYDVIVHHDGHETKLPTIDSDVLKRLVMKQYPRSNGQVSPGIIGGPIPPERPFAHQLWLDLSSMVLWTYNVINDIGDLTATAPDGTFVSDRQSLTVWERVGGVWTSLGNTTIAQNTPWKQVNLTETYRALILRFEQELYEHCPPRTSPINQAALEALPKYDSLMEAELKAFAAAYGIMDPYGSIYDPTNAFTWNYSLSAYPYATWHQVYLNVYGTTRPDLEPWFSCGFPDEATFIADAIANSALPPLTTSFDPSTMWTPTLGAYVSGLQVGLAKPAALSVDIPTGALLAPHAFGHAQQLLAMPAAPNARYVYGDLGPIELLWTRSSSYHTSRAKVFFKLDPLGYASNMWGDELDLVGSYELLPAIGRKPGIVDVQLHGEAVSNELTASVTVTLAPIADEVLELEVVSVRDSALKVTLNGAVSFTAGFTYVGTHATVTLARPRTGLVIGDKVVVTVKPVGAPEVVTTPTAIRKLEGLSQNYVHLHRVNGMDLTLSANLTWLREWEARLAYRFNTLVDTDVLKVRLGDDQLDPASYGVLLKETEFVNSSWITAMRVTLLRVGTTERKGSKNVPAAAPGGQPGDDWVFRVDIYNPKRSVVEWYELDTSGEYQTFFALNAANTQDEWKHYTGELSLRSANAPFLVTGIQNLATFMFGYAARLEDYGFVFTNVENPVIDDTTGRAIDWQLLIEQFINQQFLGIEAGSAFLFNPFSKKMWFSTPFGVMTDMTRSSSLINEFSPALLGSNGRQVNKGTYRIFRQDDLAELFFDTPVYAAHVLTSSYEHVLLFDSYTGDEILLFDAFLGQQVSRLFFTGEKQISPNGKISYGGKFLYNGGMRKNLEASVEGLLKLYDSSNTRLNAPEVERARALLGFQGKDYFRDRNTPEQTEFRFWQGEIKNKGTNLAVAAYVNAASYKTSALDEYWAYKVAEYGDAGVVIDAELKVEPDDCQTERSNFLFLESDETGLLDLFLINGGFDVGLYDWIPYDVFSIYTSEQAWGIENFDPRGSIIVTPDDEARWLRYNDLRKLSYFEADVLAEMLFTPDSLDRCYVVTDSRGRPVRADCFELVDMAQTTSQEVKYYEIGDYIPATDPAEYTSPKFKRLNHCTIQILDPALIGVPLKAIAYAPAFGKYSPNRLYDYQSNVTIRSDIIWWDPARGSQHPEAHKEVDYEQLADPAKYNQGKRVFANPSVSPLKVWGVNEVGKVWWDRAGLEYQGYSDTKLYPEMTERLARWGALADFSEVKVYEWVKSTVPPVEYEEQEGALGRPAVKELVRRERTWYQRPVAWRYSDNPELIDRAFLAYQPAKLKLSITAGRGLAVLKTGDAADLGFTAGTKFSGATYSSTSKIDTNLVAIFGLAIVTSSTPQIVVGASTNYDEGPTLVYSPNITGMTITPDEQVLGFRTNYLGQYRMSNYVSGGKYYIGMLHVDSGATQALEVQNPPGVAISYTYDFDKLGIQLEYIATGTSSIATVAAALGNPAHDITLRSAIEVTSSIAFNDGVVTHTELDSDADATTLGWIAWNDPPTNPNLGPKPPINKYEPLAGEWTLVSTALSDVVDDIILRMADQWTWFDGQAFTPYDPVWSPWRLIQDEVRTQRYCIGLTTHNAFFDTYFTFSDMTVAEVEDRVDVFVNNVKLRPNRWSILTNGALQTVNIVPDFVKEGDMVRMQVRHVQPTAEELAFDPDVEDLDPLVLVQLAYDYPYVYEQRRDTADGRGIKNYYFWVVDKEEPAAGNNMSIKKIAQLLGKHDGTYSVPQVFKFYNQLDGRPNRYALLSVKELARWVRKANTYKLRLKRNPALRDDDHDMRLKNIHAEWMLLRTYQAQLIPKELWDRLTDTACGESSLGQALPYVPYYEYDARNEGFSSYGLEVGQVMTSKEEALETIKSTILNTGVTKYDTASGELVADPISYTGFDIEQLDTYFATPASTRAFMGDLWRLAKPKQVNELFFAVLQDLLTKTSELSKMFKTSFISLSEVRTVDSAQGTEV